MNSHYGKFLAVQFFVVSIVCISAAQGAELDRRGLEKALAAKMEQLRVPGMVVCVYQHDKPVAEFALGLADVEQRKPMTKDLHFRVASISKPCVGTVVLQLVDEGKLKLDDPVSKYLTDFPKGDKMTIRQLGNMTSGLFNYIQSPDVKKSFATEPERWWKTEELLRWSLMQSLDFEPGTSYHYGNTGTILLGEVVKKVTGNSISDEVEKRVIKPLGLTHTSIAKDNSLPEPHPQGYALGTDEGPFFNRGDKRFNVTKTSPSWWGAAGNMISTADDLVKLSKAMGTGSLISKESQAERIKWIKDPKDTSYSYGFCLENYEGCYGHDGDVPGFQCHMSYYPKQDASIVILTNLYGWSVRKNPSDDLKKVVREFGLPQDDASSN
jgi:D-alanyl-D-alanine carboxypeptidase